MKVTLTKTVPINGKMQGPGTTHDLPGGEAEALIRQGAATLADATRDSKPASKGKADDAS